MNKLRGGGTNKRRPSGTPRRRPSGTARWRPGGTPKRQPVWLLVGGEVPRRQPMLFLIAGAVGAGVVGFRMLRRKTDGSAREMFEQEQTFGSPGDAGSTEGAPSEERATANERIDGVRGTGDDRLVDPVAAGESDPDEAADPTIASGSAPGRPTGLDSPRTDA